MTISVEISMYPLRDEYLPAIDKFLEGLHNTTGLKVQTNVMSTQVFGPIDLVFDTLKALIADTFGQVDQCPFVLKVLKKDLSEMSLKDY